MTSNLMENAQQLPDSNEKLWKKLISEAEQLLAQARPFEGRIKAIREEIEQIRQRVEPCQKKVEQVLASDLAEGFQQEFELSQELQAEILEQVRRIRERIKTIQKLDKQARKQVERVQKLQEQIYSIVMDQLRHLKVDHYPIALIEYVYNHPEIFTPIMLNVLDEALAKSPEELCYDQLWVVAMFTLAKYRNKEALSKVLQLVKMNSDHMEIDFLGDLLTEAVPEIIAACFDGDLSKLDGYFCLDDGLGFVNLSGAAMQYLTASGQISVDEAISFMDRNIRQVLEQQQAQHEPLMHEFIDMALSNLAEYSLDACDKIIEETHWKLGEGWLGGKREIDFLREQYAETQRSYYDECSVETHLHRFNKVIDQGVLAVSSWVGERVDEDDLEEEELAEEDDWEFSPASATVINTTKTGRNEPCTCGSGKKYKKCCLK